MQELVNLQIQSILLAKGKTALTQIFIDGGFIDNELYLYFLSKGFIECQFAKTNKPLGSAIGAAMVIDDPATLPASDRKKHSRS